MVVGGGYIGIEMAEAMLSLNFEVTLLTRGAEPMHSLDPDMGRLVTEAMEGSGIRVVTGAEVTKVLTAGSGRVRAVATRIGRVSGGRGGARSGRGARTRPWPARPGCRSASRAVCSRTPRCGCAATRTSGRAATAWRSWTWCRAACATSRSVRTPTSTARSSASNAGGGYATFPGVVGTAVTKVCQTEIARTGLLEREARAEGLQYVTATIESTNTAGYYPGAASMAVKMLAERRTGRLLGVQIVGREGAAKRIDVAAVALTARMTVDELTALDLGYAPPFSPVWDPILVAARKAVSAVR